MAFRPVGIQSELEDVIKIVNDNFRDLDNLFRSIPVKDDKGKTRILIGRQPDGTYAIVMSKDGIDIRDAYNQ